MGAAPPADFHDLIDAHKKRERSRYDPAPEVVKMAAWEWHAENRDRALGSLNHDYIAAFERASARLVEVGRMTLFDTERTDESFEESEETALESFSIEGAAIKAADSSEEGDEEALKSPGTSY